MIKILPKDTAFIVKKEYVDRSSQYCALIQTNEQKKTLSNYGKMLKFSEHDLCRVRFSIG